MTARTAAIGVGVLFLLVLLGAGIWVILGGVTAPVLTGLFVGIALGGLNLLIEALSLGWALRKRPSATLAISLGGFLVRLVMVSALTIWFAKLESVDAPAFALAYVASFMAFLGLQIWAISRALNKAGSTGRSGGPEGETR